METLQRILARIKRQLVANGNHLNDQVLSLYDEFLAVVDDQLARQGIRDSGENRSADWDEESQDRLDSDILEMLYSKLDELNRIRARHGLSEHDEHTGRRIVAFIRRIEEDLLPPDVPG